jgi:putative ATPase
MAYFAAAGDVEARGSLPVPLHLRNAGDRRMKTHGIGVGYRNPHDFEGADVEQQYLPDELAERRYYLPTDQGYEATIGGRQEARVEARAATRESGRPRRNPNPAPQVGKSDLMRARETNRKKLAETERQDAAD